MSSQLVWIKSKKLFLKIQEGCGDNLSKEDMEKGYIDYCLWSTFLPETLDIDGELEMNCLDSGMILLDKPFDSNFSLEECYKCICGRKIEQNDVIVLLEK